MRYILDSDGYIDSVSCTPFNCKDKSCQEYTGTIPEGYNSLEEWVLNANIRAYKITNGNLEFSGIKDAALKNEWSKQQARVNIITDGEPTKTGRMIDGQEEYVVKKTFAFGGSTGTWYTMITLPQNAIVESFNAFLTVGSEEYPIPLSGSSNESITAYYNKNNNTINAKFNYAYPANRNGRITVYYTI